jgi:hypothetical protein
LIYLGKATLNPHNAAPSTSLSLSLIHLNRNSNEGFFMDLTGEPRPEFETLEAPIGTMKINLAFMNDLDIVAVRIEHPCRIIARIGFEQSLRCFLTLASGVHGRFVEYIYLSMVFRYKSNMHCAIRQFADPNLPRLTPHGNSAIIDIRADTVQAAMPSHGAAAIPCA